MITRRTTLAAALLCLICSPLPAQPPEILRSGAVDLSVSFNELADLSRRARAAAEGLPEDCAELPVVSIRNGEIFKNGASLGWNASSYQANCDGMVAWQDFYGDLHRETQPVADRVSWYDVAWHGGTLVWKDSGGDLHRDNDDLGRVENSVFVKYTGDVVWKDGWGDLYRNREKFGRAENYAVAARTADVAWMDGFGTLHRNGQELGRAQSWQISDRTGVVGWLDSSRNLYKNGAQVGSDVSQFSIREDGRLIWVDASGDTHSA